MLHHTWILVLALGCRSSPPAEPEHEHARQPPACSMMKNAHLAATDGEHDVTITFTTQGDPTELRAHVHRMGAMHDHMGDPMAGPAMHAHPMMVPSHAAVDDVDHGARVVLTPTDPAQLATLRDQVHEHVEMMQRGQCPMMEDPAAPHPHHAM